MTFCFIMKMFCTNSIIYCTAHTCRICKRSHKKFITKIIVQKNLLEEDRHQQEKSPGRLDFFLPYVLSMCAVAVFSFGNPHFDQQLLSTINTQTFQFQFFFMFVMSLCAPNDYSFENVWIKVLLFVDISHTSWRKSQVYDDVDAYIRLSTPNQCSVSLFSYQYFYLFVLVVY